MFLIHAVITAAATTTNGNKEYSDPIDREGTRDWSKQADSHVLL